MRTGVGSNPNAKNKVFSSSVKVKGGSGGTTPRPPSLPPPRPLVPQPPQVAISRNLPPASSSRHERGYALLSPTLRSNPPPPPLPPPCTLKLGFGKLWIFWYFACFWIVSRSLNNAINFISSQLKHAASDEPTHRSLSLTVL